MTFREDALKERIEQIRPKLAEAREIAEKAEARNRSMTPEEQGEFDKIMAEGRCRRRDEAAASRPGGLRVRERPL